MKNIVWGPKKKLLYYLHLDVKTLGVCLFPQKMKEQTALRSKKCFIILRKISIHSHHLMQSKQRRNKNSSHPLKQTQKITFDTYLKTFFDCYPWSQLNPKSKTYMASSAWRPSWRTLNRLESLPWDRSNPFLAFARRSPATDKHETSRSMK